MDIIKVKFDKAF